VTQLSGYSIAVLITSSGRWFSTPGFCSAGVEFESLCGDQYSCRKFSEYPL